MLLLYFKFDERIQFRIAFEFLYLLWHYNTFQFTNTHLSQIWHLGENRQCILNIACFYPQSHNFLTLTTRLLKFFELLPERNQFWFCTLRLLHHIISLLQGLCNFRYIAEMVLADILLHSVLVIL